jgi:hypothetical protein
MRKQNQQGSAMIIVLCCMAILMVLVLALLLSSSTLVANINRKRAQEQCKISAVSLSKVIEQNLHSDDNGEGSLQKYLKDEITGYLQGKSGSWTYYDEEDEDEGHDLTKATKTFYVSQDSFSDRTGTITLTGYWKSDQDLEEITDDQDLSISVIFTVKAEKNGESYRQRIHYTTDTGTWEWGNGYFENEPDKG